ncbi:hypothetical protein ACGFZQ_03335 [Streptomyces sp. NPDC048254]|uniref:hypothetical protein n=1 Tax=Streptomyces sp. NPDC048254 TaxID=3365525 RepID=UPI003710C7A2
MSGEDMWEAAKRRYPLGSAARGRVKDRFPFGVFLELDDAPGVNGFVDLLSYNPDGTINDPWPTCSRLEVERAWVAPYLRERITTPVYSVADRFASWERLVRRMEAGRAGGR